MDTKNSPMNAALAAEIRAEKGAKSPRMSSARLAELSGMPKMTMDRILRGERDINITQLGLIAHALEVDPDDLTRKAVNRMGGLNVLIEDSNARLAANTTAMSEAAATNVTRLHSRNDQLTAEQIDAGNEDKAASEITPESAFDEDGDS